jgi:phosphoesterase RecJ-like protein
MAEGFINYARSVAGVEVAVLFREQEPKKYKVSLRSKTRINVTDITTRFGGGGHRHAGGCTLEKTLPEVRTEILAAIEAAL